MKVEDFEDFCVKVIDGYIGEFTECQKKYKCIRKSVRARNNVFKFYQRKRDEIKDNYMEKSTENETALDRHKVAACMMYAILKSRVLKVNRFVPHLPEKLLMANEYLAVYVGINIIEQYRLNEGKGELENKLIFPITYHETESIESDFIDNLCKSLYYLRHKIGTMDIFAYSSILFFIEKYTDTILEYDARINSEKINCNDSITMSRK